ncbi:MAG: sce7726 family protein [Vicinamibacteria bacterium]
MAQQAELVYRARLLMIRDLEIRAALHRRLDEFHAADPHTAVVDEFSICRASARVDVAVINGHLAGFEIKSEADRLDRLKYQARFYDRVFDRMTLVCSPRHLEAARKLIPDWWAVWVAASEADTVTLEPVTEGAHNPGGSRFARAQLLWREDMVELLLAAGAGRSVVRLPRRDLIPALLAAVCERELDEEIRRRLRRRAAQAPALMD